MQKSNKLKMYGRIALEISKASTCIRVQVGAVLLKDGRIIASGYNGVPASHKHCSEIFAGLDMSLAENKEKHRIFSTENEQHAETNLIANAAKFGIATNDTVLIVTVSPCINCAKLLLSAGIKEVYYIQEYDRDIKGIEFLKNNGIKVEKLDLE